MMNVNDIVKRQIDALGNADVSALKAKFEELYGFECGVTNSKNLRNRIAYKIQEIYFGGLAEADKAMLESIADKDPAANVKTPKRKHVKFVKGTRLCRNWKDKNHEVLVRQDGGFEYEGEIYRSLTAIAEKITGTHWNGKKFFGVK